MREETQVASRGTKGFERDKWPFYWLTRVVGRYLEQLDGRLKKIGLDVSRWRVLMCLGEDSAISISEMAELAIVKVPTMMKLVQRMESDGLVEMATRVSDGRVTEVSLTEKGLLVREQALAIAQRIHDRCFADISAKDRNRLNLDLRAIFQALEV
jgi:DNA-binding MarR family transcriptional regulator